MTFPREFPRQAARPGTYWTISECPEEMGFRFTSCDPWMCWSSRYKMGTTPPTSELTSVKEPSGSISKASKSPPALFEKLWETLLLWDLSVSSSPGSPGWSSSIRSRARSPRSIRLPKRFLGAWGMEWFRGTMGCSFYLSITSFKASEFDNDKLGFELPFGWYAWLSSSCSVSSTPLDDTKSAILMVVVNRGCCRGFYLADVAPVWTNSDLFVFPPTKETNETGIPGNKLTRVERLAQKHISPFFANLHLISWHLSIEFVIIPHLSCLIDDRLNEIWSDGGQHSKKELSFNFVSSSPSIRHIPQEGVEHACLRPYRFDTKFGPVWNHQVWNELPINNKFLVP